MGARDGIYVNLRQVDAAFLKWLNMATGLGSVGDMVVDDLNALIFNEAYGTAYVTSVEDTGGQRREKAANS